MSKGWISRNTSCNQNYRATGSGLELSVSTTFLPIVVLLDMAIREQKPLNPDSDNELEKKPQTYYIVNMKSSVLTIRLEDDLESLLTKVCRQSGKNRGEIERETLRRQLRITQFETPQKRIMPFAEALSFLTDNDVL